MHYIFLFLLSLSALQAEETLPTPPQGEYASYQGIVLILVGFIFMYFILWRPEQKRRKEMEELRSALKKGDKVIAVGIIGQVDQIKEDSVVLKMVDGSKIEVIKAAINDVIPEGEKA